VQLDQEREFLRQANIGSESMRSEDQQRVSDIGVKYRWRNPKAQRSTFSALKEIENLSIPSRHPDSGLSATSSTPYCCHHQELNNFPGRIIWKTSPSMPVDIMKRMDGKGYPKGLTRDQMSFRPGHGDCRYFRALDCARSSVQGWHKLSQGFDSGQIRHNVHIDPDLFEVFVRARATKNTPKRFLDPRQIDAVNEFCTANRTGKLTNNCQLLLNQIRTVSLSPFSLGFVHGMGLA